LRDEPCTIAVGVTEVAADESTIRHGTVPFSVPNQLVAERLAPSRAAATGRVTGAQPSGRDRECPGWNRD